MYQIKERFISRNRSRKLFKPEGIVVHETDNLGASAENHYHYFDSADRGASAHAFIDWDEIIQTIPWNEKAGHAGAYANDRFIGIELCRPAVYDPDKFFKIWRKAIWLFSYLYINELKIKSITKDNLLSHDEVRIRFGGTTHTDPVEYFKEYDLTVDDFRNDVQNGIDRMLKLSQVSSFAKEAAEWVLEQGISDGTRPKNFLTREEAWTMLYRMRK